MRGVVGVTGEVGVEKEGLGKAGSEFVEWRALLSLLECRGGKFSKFQDTVQSKHKCHHVTKTNKTGWTS